MVFGLDFIDDGDNDWGVAGGVVKDVGDVIFDFLLEHGEVGVARAAAVGFGAEVVADFADELFAVVEVDEGAGDDIGGFDEAASLLVKGEDDNEDAFVADVEAVFNDGFVDAVVGVVVEFAADVDATAAFDGLIREEFDDVAVIANEDVVFRDACDFFGHLGVLGEHVEFAVDW